MQHMQHIMQHRKVGIPLLLTMLAWTRSGVFPAVSCVVPTAFKGFRGFYQGVGLEKDKPFQPVKCAVFGAAGGIGQPLSLLMGMYLPPGSTLRLYDVVNAHGVAADMSHIDDPVTVEGYLGKGQLEDACKDLDLAVIPAGVPRKPGMTRQDLFNVNAGIVRDLCTALAKQSPKAFVALITNPVNSTVPIAHKAYERVGVSDAGKRIFGVTTLDIVRANRFVSFTKNLHPWAVDVPILGGHSGATIIPLLSVVEKLNEIKFTEEERETLVKRIQNAGTEVVEAKAGTGSATLSMARAASNFIRNLIVALRSDRVICECCYTHSPTDAPASYFSQPTYIGKNGKEGVFKFEDPTISLLEEQMIEKMLPELNENIQVGLEFMQGQE